MVYLSGRAVQTSAELVELYKQRIILGGFTSETLFYKNRQQHEVKLRMFARHVACLPAGQSLLDVGCGYGELLHFVKPSGPYLGIDLVNDFVAEAHRRYPQNRFEVGDVLDCSGREFDWVLLVGVLSSVPEPAVLLSRAGAVARSGIIFDVTLDERLPADYADLSRWSLTEVEEVLQRLDYVITETCDIGATWALFRAEPSNLC
jgi:2-polyprenyl-3-methyl-5-hydroxy-6-metoxy-1,4-benzoquinol methylase